LPEIYERIGPNLTLVGISTKWWSRSPDAKCTCGVPLTAKARFSKILVRPQRDKVNIRPAEILMVAAHNYDLNAANEQGFGRPSEKGPAGSPGNQPDPSFDFNATSFIDLAEQLGADFRGPR
jgi:hypothetical protein